MKKILLSAVIGAIFFFSARLALNGANDLKTTNLAVALLVGAYAAKSAL